MLLWTLFFAAGLVAILFLSMYPRPDYNYVVEQPIAAVPIVQFVDAHKAFKEYAFNNIKITGIDEEGANIGDISAIETTWDTVKSYLTDGLDTNNASKIQFKYVCLDMQTNTVASQCNVAKTNDFLTTFAPIDANWDTDFPDWKGVFAQRTLERDFCGFYDGQGSFTTLNDSVYTLPQGLRPTKAGLLCITVNPYYKHTGLVAMYDGINNSGFGHDNTLTSWKNLVGNNRFDAKSTTGTLGTTYSWGVDHLKNVNGAQFATNIVPMNYGQSLTIETAYDYSVNDTTPPVKEKRCGLYKVQGGKKNNPVVYLMVDVPSVTWFAPGNPAVYSPIIWFEKQATWRYLSRTYPKGYVSWRSFPNSSRNGEWYVSALDSGMDETRGALKFGEPYVGETNAIEPGIVLFVGTIQCPGSKIHAFRFYDKPLDDVERNRNKKIDELRYKLKLVTSLSFNTKSTTACTYLDCVYQGYLYASGNGKYKGTPGELSRTAAIGSFIIPCSELNKNTTKESVCTKGTTYRILRNGISDTNARFAAGFSNGMPSENSDTYENTWNNDGFQLSLTVPDNTTTYLIIYIINNTSEMDQKFYIFEERK